MLTSRAIVLAFATSVMLLASHGAVADEGLPEWFRYDESRPYTIFDAWKSLSTREATICLGENWQVLAGQLQNERGEALPNTPIAVAKYGGIRGYHVQLQTDNRGHFIIYAPFSLDLVSREQATQHGFLQGCLVSATPGFPDSPAARVFAAQHKAVRPCLPKLLARNGERAYYVLTCEGQSTFRLDEFRTFEREFTARKVTPREAWRDRPRDPEGDPKDRIVRRYDVRVVDQAEKAVSEAIVKYYFSRDHSGCYQIRQTDAEGQCRVEEWLKPGKAAADERRVDDFRILTIDAPGFGVGPVRFDPRPDVANVIRLAQPAVVTGRIVDYAGQPASSRLSVKYKRPSHIAFEADFHSQADGTFRFERVMPDEEFCVVSDGFDFRWRQRPSARSAWITLKPGAVSESQQMRIPMASGLRGIVVTEGGAPVPVGDHGRGLYLDYGDGDRARYVGTANGLWGPSDGRFGFYGLDDRPFRIRVTAPDVNVEPSEPLQLEPGELRFVRVTLKGV